MFLFFNDGPITGKKSGATETVISSFVSQQTSGDFNDSVTEFIIGNLEGTFQVEEVVSGISTLDDRETKFTVYCIVSNVSIDHGGSLYSKG